MSFSPLPSAFLEHLDQCRCPFSNILDLGCGDGVFFDSVSPPVHGVLGLDRHGPEMGSSARVVADALEPPFCPHSMDLIVASNLLRQILPGDPLGSFLEKWVDLLRPEGVLFLFEDEPADFPVPVGNYKHVQELLFRLMPENRGPLLPRSNFESILEKTGQRNKWVLGTELNLLKPDIGVVVDFLAGCAGAQAPEIEQLLNSVEVDGLAYGSFWWACRRAK